MDIKKLAEEFQASHYFGEREGENKIIVSHLQEFAKQVQRLAVGECIKSLLNNWEGFDTHNRDMFIAYMRGTIK